MIRIDRRLAEAPESLRRGDEDLARIEKLADADELRSKEFKAEIYGTAEVKKELWEMQHFKCCYCERIYEKKRSTVEHFRPKTSARRCDGSTDTGYWWLAYEFENLYFSCANCNSSKGTRFPLAPGSTPLVPREKPWEEAEEALLIDPGFEDPEPHLTFVPLPGKWSFQVVARNGSRRGRETVDAAGLDRDELTTLRNAHYRHHLRPVIRRFAKARQDGDNDAMADALADARELVRADREYSLFAKAIFQYVKML